MNKQNAALILTLAALLPLAFTGGCAQPGRPPLHREVFIGTDRETVKDAQCPGYKRGDGLRVATCTIGITPDKGWQPPAAASPQFPPSTQAVFSLDKQSLHYSSCEKEEYETFSKALQQSIRQSESKDIFLFIHGYNARFQDAVLTTAQLACDLDFKGTIVCFDWPAWGELDAYLYDEENSQWAIAHLVDFLNKLKTEAGTQRIHVLTHSMGSRVFLNALHEMQLRGQFNDSGRSGRNGRFFSEVIFAAPDMDRDMFIDRLVSVSTVADHFTIYGSCNDRALRGSGVLHRLPRAGEGGKALAINHHLTPNMYVIDASWVDPSFLGHFCYRSPTVANDIKDLFARTAPTPRPIPAGNTTQPDDPADPGKRPLLVHCHGFPLEDPDHKEKELNYWKFSNAKPQAFAHWFTSCE